jgi:hypothetical protein
MVIPVLFFVAALTVKQDQTPLRAGCDAADEVVQYMRPKVRKGWQIT